MVSFIDKGKFAYAYSSLDEADIVMFGAPYDFTASNRAGTRFGPQAIRQESYTGIEEYSPYFDMEINELKVHDLGDIELPFGDKEHSLRLIGETVEMILRMGKKSVMLGGEHLVSLPALNVYADVYQDLRIVQLDAHLDDIDVLYGSRISHGTVMRRIYERWNEPERIWQVGVRSGGKEEFHWAKSHTKVFPFGLHEFLDEMDLLCHYPVYITLDLDVFDSSLIPGTGTPEAGGIFFQEFMQFVMRVKELNWNVVGMDIVELSPELDPSGSSSILAAKVLREMLFLL